MIALVPLMVTFGLYAYLGVYYIFFYLKPTIEMRYDSISFDAQWVDDEKERENSRNWAIGFAFVFGYSAICLFIAIVRSILTNPGNIPDDHEWDFSESEASASEGGQEETDSMKSDHKSSLDDQEDTGST